MSSAFDFSLEPLKNFTALYKEAVKAQVPDANAMVLSTVDGALRPSSRVVFYKDIIREGLVFYTNFDGEKSKDISKNPNVCLNFFWPVLQQQIRIEGIAEKVKRAESEAYFQTRARLSQLGAWASDQSQKIESLEVLEKRVKEFEVKFHNEDVPCPENWGGYRVEPLKFEFWFGRQGRLHERYVYEKNGSDWVRSLLSP
jgi:pyridoxamine 5'-phosphate oxidase